MNVRKPSPGMPRDPSTKTLKILFAQSRNQCAAPGCENPIIAEATELDQAAPVAQVAHIVPRSAGGPRADPSFPRDRINDESNLILLCGHHHALVDAHDSTYTAEELRRWKAAHLDAEPAAKTLMERADAKARQLQFEEAAELFGEAADRASEPQRELQAEAHLGAARCLFELPRRVPAPDAAARIERHVEAAAASGVRHAAVAVARTWVARVRKDPELALRLAVEANEAADATPVDKADAIRAQLGALLALNRVDEAVALCDGPAREIVEVVNGEPWLRLAIVRLIALAAGTSDELPSAVSQFAERARTEATSASQRDGIYPLEIAYRVGELASTLGDEGCIAEAVTTSATAYEIAGLQADPELVLSLALQTIEVAAAGNYEAVVRRVLASVAGDASVFIRKEDPTSGPVYQVLTAAARGRCFVQLAQHEERETESTSGLLLEALNALEEAAGVATSKADKLSRLGDLSLLCADIAYWRGQAAAGLGQSAEAAQHFRAVRSESAKRNAGFWRARGLLAWVNESKAIRQSGHLDDAYRTLQDAISAIRGFCAEHPDDPGPPLLLEHAEGFISHMERHEVPVFKWLRSPEAGEISRASLTSTLHHNVAAQAEPLVSWWQKWTEWNDGETGEMLAPFLDFWGRGGLCRVAAAVRPEAHRAVAVDARSLEEVRRWARVLCPLFETVIVKWKGPIGDYVVQCPIPADYGSPGGHGYEIVNEAIYDVSSDPNELLWVMSVSNASLVTHELAAFLANEAMPLLRAGRLVVVPAPLVGCTQSAIGWTDDLFVTGLLGGAVSVVGAASAPVADASSQRRILDLTSTVVPYIENVTLADLATVLEEAGDWLGPLRSVILKAIAGDDLRHERWDQIAVLQDEINDACRELEGRYGRIVRAEHSDTWRLAQVNSSVVATERPDESHRGDESGEPITDLLRTIGRPTGDPGPWIPYWLLRGAGGYLNWTAPLDNGSPEDAPGGPECPIPGPRSPSSSWLHPGTLGFGMRAVVG